ncbi:hypothetical protein HDU97_006008 [Phlyctochytrium planicorne]|nr:hypothetical protein HDU97_006008 [Phlyctochytrium planicorne]
MSTELVYTPVAEIASIVASVRKTFSSHKTKPLEWRRQQLNALIDMIHAKKTEMMDALNKDHQRSDPMFSFYNELLVANNEAVHALENLDQWTAPEYPDKDPLLNATDSVEVRHDPLGVVLIIGPWNYPIQLLLVPLVSAIAAGNAVVIKPSEVSSHSAAVLSKIIPQYLDSDAIKVVNGGVAETTALLAEKFNHIFYTGNGHVGKIIMTAAAKYLTPVTLELGGKSPVYVHEDAQIENAAKRIFWAKTNNSGQTCVAPDYLLVHKNAVAKFVPAFEKAYKEFFGDDAKASPLFSRVINRHHFNRLNKILERQKAAGGKIEIGGRVSADDLYIEPTLVTGVKLEDPLMEDELFGPMISLIAVDGPEEAISIINARYYIFHC